MDNLVDVQDGNRVIAEFDGWEFVTVGYVGCDDETEWQHENEQWMEEVGLENVGQYIVNIQDKAFHEVDKIKYHESWDWFMPAFKKFFDYLQKQYNKPDYNKHSATKGDLIEVDIHCAVREFDLAKAHWHLVEAIKWYNQQPKTPTT